jgi:hypothetical protein
MGYWRQGKGASLGPFIAISGPQTSKARQRARSCLQPAPQLPATGPQATAPFARARVKNTLQNHDRTWVPSTSTVLGNVVWCCPLRLTGLLESPVAPTPKWDHPLLYSTPKQQPACELAPRAALELLAHVTIRFSNPFSDTCVVARTFTTVANARLFVDHYCNHCYREYRLEGSLDHSWIPRSGDRALRRPQADKSRDIGLVLLCCL